jgi:PKD repeat protein
MAWVAGVQGLDAATTRYVWRNNPNTPVPPYDGGWQSAATNIQDALDVAVDGDTVLVTNGVYNAGGRVAPGDTTLKTRASVTNAVTLVSVNGPEVTLIVGQPHPVATGLGDTAVRGVYLPTNSVLSGFTVTNGFTRSGTTATASYFGGGIRCEGVGSLVTNCVVVGNSAATRGGGVYGGTVNDCAIVTNAVLGGSTSAGGGGVHSASVRQSLLERNVASGTSTDGGGAHTCVISESTLRSNVAGKNGGGAYSGTLVSCTVESNRAAQQGGGAHSTLVVTNSLIRWNTAVQNGGGLYKGAVTDSVIASNTVTGTSYDGGGYWGDTAANDRLVACLIVGNSARNGGGVYTAVLSNCVVQANRALGTTAATGSGGGYYVNVAAGYQVFNTRFLDNEANYQGGGAYQGKFFNCVFSGNRAAQAGGAYLATGYQLNSCSVMGNTATNLYGGTFNGTISNSIVMANAAVTSPNYSGGTFRHSCADPLPTGAGNTNLNPLVSGYCDPHLLPGSPLIGVGAVNAWMANATDLDGDARVSAGLVDIGADQFTGSTLEGALEVSIVAVTNVWAVNWPNSLRAEATGKVKWIAWSFGDGATAGDVNPVTHSFAAPGPYTVTVTVSNETHSATATYAITVVDYIVYASPTGGHVAPFASWADAATNLQAAVDAVSMPGGRVLATNGVYAIGARRASGQTVTNRLVLDKAVRVESVNGPEVTSIAGRWHSEATPLGASAIRGVYIGGSAILCGFTVSNGATASATGTPGNGHGGGLFLEAGGVATNCVVSGCRAWAGGGAASLSGAAGDLRGCLVTNNAALGVSVTSSQGGGSAYLNAVGCLLVSNTAYYGGGTYDCIQEACLLSDNMASGYGGGAYFGTLTRCHVRNNTASATGLGGGVYDATLFSCLISGNTAQSGGGVYGSTAGKSMRNCTVVGNTATYAPPNNGGGGFYSSGGTYLVLNSIIYYNIAPLVSNIYGGSVSYTCSLPLPAGTGNRDEAPMLADLSSARLLSGSPCVGVGLYEAWMASARDLEGESRSEGGSVDMGADQLFETGLTGVLAVAISGPVWPYFPGVNYTFTAEIEGAPAHVYWNFGDGATAAQTPFVTHAWSEGDYVLRLTVSNATHSTQATLAVNVAPDTRYVSLTGSHTPPFRTWETASTNLQDAADVVLTGGRIQVAAGVYDVGGRAAGGTEIVINRLLVTNAVTVTAVEGPSVTFIVGEASGAPVTNGLGQGAVRGVRLAAGASLSGFTVSNGHTRWSTTGTEGDVSGGGIYCADGSSVVRGCVVTACAAASRGGGIYRGTILGTTVEGCGVYSTGSNLGWGGGICYASLISNCVIRANTARSSGGGAYMNAPVVGTLFDGNASLGGGGGCFMATTGREMRECQVVNNTAATSGGGVVAAAMTDCLLTNNTAATGGGYYNTSDTALKRCRIEYNRASGNAGGTLRADLYRCYVIGNSAGGVAGGSLYGTHYSSVVSGNRAGTAGGGTYASILECCTVVDNEAPQGGGSYSGTAYFSILYYNRATTDSDYSATTIYGCCTPSVSYGPLRNPPQLTALRDPHLLAASPCVDNGEYRGWMQGVNGLDIDDEARYGVEFYDVGADERQEAGLSGPLTVSVSAAQTLVGLGYAPVLWAEATGRVGEMRWDFGDGASMTNQNPVRHVFTTPGVYEVVVTVSNATHLASETQTVTVVAGDVFVSPTGTHVPPFDSWTTAATNIQEAVDAALWGGTVWLADGDYALGGRPATGLTQANRVCIEKAITLRGDQGPDGVIIRGSWHEPGVMANGPNAMRGIYLGHAEARLLDLTVTGGASGTVLDEDDGGGVFAISRNALASNCVVTASSAYDEGGGVFSGTWVACQLRDNSSGYAGGGASQARILSSLVSDNTATDSGGGAYESTVLDTVLTGNMALQADGGGISYCLATRCRLSNNSAYDDGGASSDSDLVNCLLNSNTAAYGGGAAYGTLELCTVVTNTASVKGGGLYNVNPVTNSIVWANGAPLEAEHTGSYFSTSLTSLLPSGQYDLGDNIMGDPEFVNPDAGNFRLRGNSPCMNTGVADGYALEEGATDLDGRKRVLGSAVDRGAYEYVAVPGFAALGTPIDWLDDYFAGPDWDALELDDPDNDGFKTWEEYIALTHPTETSSRFVIAEMVTTETGVNLSFDTAAGRVYTVLAADTLSATFQPAVTPVSGTGGRMTVPVSDPGPFYRVRVALP